VSRLLVLEEVGLVIPHALVEAIEAVDSTVEPGPWLPSLVQQGDCPTGPRRALLLRSGARVEVPAAMHFVEGVEVLELPEQLRESASRCGVVGLAEVDGSLKLVCDPNLVAGAGADEAGGDS
jgi:hypothetical protein